MIPSTLGPYEIRAEIARGGMATVYLAYQQELDRDVAIKLILENDGDGSLARRFQREAKIIASLEHPHILPVYDFVTRHQPPYIVMRYVDGGTLKERLASGPLPYEKICNILSQIAAALDYAHASGIIHRDVKPSNILLDKSGNALVADFGIARSVVQPGNGSTLTQPGATLGTPGYSAPEQSIGAQDLTPQADIYSLGVMFFEMITGQPPYRADNSLALIMKHLNDPIPEATAFKPQLPSAVDSVIARAMAKDPTQRFASATEFAQAAIEALCGRAKVLESQETADTPADGDDKTALTSSVGDLQEATIPLHLSLSMLGSVQITLNGQPIGDIGTFGRALLGFLAMERDQPYRREELAEKFWPNRRDKKGQNNLRNLLSVVRKTIEDQQANPPFLLISRLTLQFNAESNFTLDVDEFTSLIEASSRHIHNDRETCAECIERLEKAIELYRGAFAQDLALADNDDFESWLIFQREKFEALALDALFTLAEYHARRAEYDLARRYAWRQIELQPWREEAYQQLMRLLALSGQRAAALAQYERCCQVLLEEQGAEPSPETVALYNKIRAGEIKPEPQNADSVPGLRRSNLPAATTSFVGRRKELERLLHYLADPACRLVTITGLGGMGKTRLALEAARQAASMFDRVCFVSLAALNSVALIPSTIADALQFTTTNQDDFAGQLVSYLSDKRLLLTLDNLEHLTDGLSLLAEIAANAPDVKLLLTSREKLNLQGEWVLPLNGLPLPSTAASKENDTAESAVELFVQRTRMVLPDFVLSNRVLPDILRICRLVDGMPLGIELASAWMQTLNCQEIADSIESDLGFLSISAGGLPERHQSLRVVFDHSWKLLSMEQQRVFRAISVFRGGFQADAALEVGGATQRNLLEFVSKSMLRRDPAGRYQIHELLHQYARGKLQESGEAEAVCARHLRYFLTLAETAELHLQGGQQLLWLERLEAENDNLRAALEWSIGGGTAETGLKLAAALWFFSHVRNYLQESPEWLEKLLEAAPDASPALRAKALFAAGWLAQGRRDLQLAESLSSQSLELAQEIKDKRGIAYPLSTLAWLSYFHGDYQKAIERGEESLALFREVKDRWGIVRSLNILGYIAESQARYPQAEQYQREAIDVARAAGDNDNLAWSKYLLARIKAECCEYNEAEHLCHESLEIYRELRSNFGTAMVLYTLGDSALGLGNYEPATQYCNDSVRLLEEVADYWAIGGPISCLGMVAYRQGNMMEATRLSQESLKYFRQIGDRRGTAYTLNTLGCIAHQQKKYAEAILQFKESLKIRREIGIPRGAEICFEHLAGIALVGGQMDRAARLLGAADGLRDRLHALRPEADLDYYSWCVDSIKQNLGASAFKTARSRGKALPLDEAIAFAREDSTQSIQ